MATFQKALARLMDERGKPETGTPAAPSPEELGRHLATDQVAAAAFSEVFLTHADGALDALLPPEQLTALAASAFRFLSDKLDRPFAVRVYHPAIETDGWSCDHTVVEAVVDDQPHIVDTLCEALQARGGDVEVLLNPVLGVERDPSGALLAVATPQADRRAEHFFHAHVGRLEATTELQEALAEHLAHLHRVGRDNRAMRDRATAAAAAVEAISPQHAEAAAFIRWLLQGHFSLLGFADDGAGVSLGLLDDRSAFAAAPIAAAAALVVFKTAARSPVQRLDYLDEVRLRRDGGECRLLGLFTPAAYRQPTAQIPILRQRFEHLSRDAERAASLPSEVVRALFDRLPVDLAAGATDEDLLDLIATQHAAETSGEVDLHRLVERFAGNVFLTLFLPRRQLSAEAQQRVAELLARDAGALLASHVVQDERPLARVHFLVAASTAPAPPLADLTHRVRLALRAGSAERRELATETVARNAASAPAPPPASTAAGEAPTPSRSAPPLAEGAIDVVPGQRGRLLVRLNAPADGAGLSEIVSLLEDHGLLALSEEATQNPDGSILHEITAEPSRSTVVDAETALPTLLEGLRAARDGQCRSDALSALILRAQLPWRAIALLRALVSCAAQRGGAAPSFAAAALVDHPDAARALVDLFAAKFDPHLPIANPAQRKREVASLEARLDETCELAEGAEGRLLLRSLGKLVAATTRTNFYLPENRDAALPVIALKLGAPSGETGGALSVHSEIYAQAPSYEAVVLRSAAVANIELQLVDRPDELRQHARARLRARALQSSLDVASAGAGAVYLRQRAGLSRDAIQQIFRELAGTLLSITDNVIGDNVLPPRDLVVRDGIDPYLVLVRPADDPALADALNELSLARGYWLEDAFCTGGVESLSARETVIGSAAAWECARQHFHELGRDLARERVDAIGIGGPAELRLFPTVRLRAAFDRSHVFLDPEPDARESFEERQRLAHETQATWGDYSSRRLSRGGAVLPRTGRQLQLSPEARALLGFADDAARYSGDDLVRAILRLPADLLWADRCGLFIRLSAEQLPLGGRDDDVWIAVDEVQAGVAVECAPAFSTAARVAFEHRGGRLYGTSVDGVAAAALADRETTLKIALRSARNQRAIETVERDQMLGQAGREIAEILARESRRQALSLGVDQARATARPDEFAARLQALAVAEQDERAVQAATRRSAPATEPLTHPELATAAVLTKLELRTAILETSLCEDPQLQPWIEEHFATALRGDWDAGLATHPLRHEIAALEISRRLVDTMGVTFASRACRFTGRSLADVAKAWTASYLIGRGEELIAELEHESDAVRAGDEIAARRAVGRSLERATLELLETQPAEASLAKLVDRLSSAAAELLQSWPDRLAASRRRVYDRQIDTFTAAGYSTDTADSIVRIASLTEVFQICDVSIRANTPRGLVCEAFLAVDRLFDLTWLENTLDDPPPGDGRWESAARYALRSDLAAARRELTRALADLRPPGASIADMVAEYRTRRSAGVERVRQHLAAAAAAPQPNLAALVVAVRELGRLAAR